MRVQRQETLSSLKWLPAYDGLNEKQEGAGYGGRKIGDCTAKESLARKLRGAGTRGFENTGAPQQSDHLGRLW
ncbi:hypothetical protein MRX96_037868 [Rhipicephalus microplus]